MSERDYADTLLMMAKKDIQALHGMLNAEIFADEIFGFHAQQAIEKCLKAWIAALDCEFPLTHDISLLLSVLDEHRQQVSAFRDLIEYSAFAVQFRYSAFEFNETLNRSITIQKVDALFNRVSTFLTSSR